MSARRSASREPDVLDRVRAARPENPSFESDAADLAAAQARVMARVRVLVAGDAEGLRQAEQRRARARQIIGGLAAALLLGVLVGQLMGREAAAPMTDVEHATARVSAPDATPIPNGKTPNGKTPNGMTPDGRTSATGGESDDASGVTTEAVGLPRFVLAALDGDAEARRRVRLADRSLRRRILDEAMAGHPRAPALVTLLAGLGRPQGFEETRRLAELARIPRLAHAAIQWLAKDASRQGLEALGALLLESPDHEVEIVAGLRKMAQRGRARAVLAALEEGLALDRREAARAFLEIGGAGVLPRLLRRAPSGVLADAGLGRVVREGSPTLAALLARHVERGLPAAQRLAQTARLDVVVSPLVRRAQSADPADARAAVDALAAIDSVAADLGLGAALGGPAADRALLPLRRRDGRRLDALARRVRTSVRDAPAALAALAAAGSRGLDRLQRLAEHAGLAPHVVTVLAAAPDVEASERLAALAARRALVEPVARALAQRLDGGDTGAGEALVALARRGDDRLVFRVLQPLGVRAVPWVTQLGEEPRLALRAKRLLRRLAEPTDGEAGLERRGSSP